MNNWIDKVLADANSPAARVRALKEIHKHGGPVYGSDPDNPKVIVERRPDGTTQKGRFIDRQFVPFDGKPVDAY